MEDWEIVSEGAPSDDCSSWEIADYPGTRDSPSDFDEETQTPAPSEAGRVLVAATARANYALRMEMMPIEVPTEVQRVRKVQKPKIEVVKGGKHWQNKQALMAKAQNTRHQYHRRAKCQACA